MNSAELWILDGATGTMLQKRGMAPGQKPELLNLENPRMIIDLHKDYIMAGSQILNACTFGANRYKLQDTGYTPAQIIGAAIENARAACRECGKDNVRISLDVGPIGQLLEPYASLSFEEAVDIYAEMVRAGVEYGADQILLETFTDLYDLKAAVIACKENCDLPILASMSFEEDGRTFMGCTIPAMARTLESLGVQAVGFNCSTGPDKMISLVKELACHTSLPMIVKPNAGLPDPVTGQYDMDPEAFRRAMEACVQAGASIIGGCCGTTPDHIRAIRNLEISKSHAVAQLSSFICTPSHPLFLKGVHMAGERINPTGKKRLQQALLEKDYDYVVRLALEQQKAGASLLDVNVGYPGVDEEKMLAEVVRRIQAVCTLPLMLDSSSVPALEKALRIYNGKPVVNSVNGKQEVLDSLLPVVKKYGAAVVGLCVDEEGIAQSCKKRLEIARRILEAAARYDIPKSDVWIDALTLTVSAQQEQAAETLKAIHVLHHEWGLQCVLGVSNISFGLPNRPLLTSAFLLAAMEAGLSVPIVNPNMGEIQDAIAAFKVLSGQDDRAADYIARYGDAKIQTKASSGSLSLNVCIMDGLESDAAVSCKELLKTMDPLDVVETVLIPALDVVGKEYEAKRLYLPQLLSSAQAAQAAFEVIRDHMAGSGEAVLNKGTIVMATVQGDIHDIGKNIVKTVLENYGYKIVDLGKDVAPEKIVEAAVSENARLVGLSALMTTTLPAMEKTAELLGKLENPPVVMAGGAVVTEAFARSIGAVYSKDANAGVAIAREVYGD